MEETKILLVIQKDENLFHYFAVRGNNVHLRTAKSLTAMAYTLSQEGFDYIIIDESTPVKAPFPLENHKDCSLERLYGYFKGEEAKKAPLNHLLTQVSGGAFGEANRHAKIITYKSDEEVKKLI